jgi:hypothetical protein
MKYKEWDFDSIISSFCYIREKPLDPHVKESVIEELRKLNFYGWDTVCNVAESVMSHGRYKLNDNLWLIVRNAVNDKIREIRYNKKTYAKAEPKYKQSGFNLPALQTRIISEISTWVNCTPPLKYKGIPIVLNEDGYNSTPFDFEAWIDQGKPKTSSILLDEYLNIYYNALMEEELRQVDGIIIERLDAFFRTLKDLRVAQTEKRTGGPVQKT